MNNLSEAGRLYLADYAILKEAQDDVHSYLETVIDHVYEALKEAKEQFNPTSPLAWGIWRNSDKTKINIDLVSKKEQFPFINKLNFTIRYRDIRLDKYLKRPDTVGVSMWSTNGFLSNIKKLSTDRFNGMEALAKENGIDLDFTRKYNFKEIIELDLNDASKSADNIVESLQDKWHALNEVVELLAKNE
ncbi:MAG: hypothetical protein FH749_02590 [Firmicutes bacterium]|nr:hypothetical protein [Bacillota bacterium]